jgi:hypothetical protein
LHPDSKPAVSEGDSPEVLADEAGIQRTYMGSVARGERNISSKIW